MARDGCLQTKPRTSGSQTKFVPHPSAHIVDVGVPTLRAGVGRTDIRLPANLFPLDGFTGVHDPLAVRVLLLDDGRTRVGIVVIDLTSLPDGLITSTKAILKETAGVLPASAIICASHSSLLRHLFFLTDRYRFPRIPT